MTTTCDSQTSKTESLSNELAILEDFLSEFPTGPTAKAFDRERQAFAKIKAALTQVETNDDLPLARNALGNLYMAVLKFGPIDRDIQFAMREAAKLLGPPYLSEKTECDRGIHERGATDICVRCGTMLMPSDTR